MIGRGVLMALFDRLTASSDEVFVETAYRVILGRPADPGALANCVARLRRGEARILLVQDLVASEEFVAKARARGEELDRRDYDVHGVKLALYDVPGYPMRDVVVGELLSDTYGIDGIAFAPGDKVVDVGGNLGIVSVYVARKHPGVEVFVYEPVPDNFRILQRNLEANGVSNVCAFPKAVTADRRPLELFARRDFLGGASAHYSPERVDRPGHLRFQAESLTLDDVFAEHGIERCKLLKIDCEGSEHEILTTTGVLGRVEHLAGEFHINDRLRKQGYSLERLREHCARFVPPERTHCTTVEMGE